MVDSFVLELGDSGRGDSLSTTTGESLAQLLRRSRSLTAASPHDEVVIDSTVALSASSPHSEAAGDAPCPPC